MMQDDFEAVKLKALDRGLPRLSKSEKQETARRQWDDKDKRRIVLRLQTMISELQREVANLEMSIHSELNLARGRERACSAYLDSAQMMKSRRENLKATIAGLTEKVNRLEAQTPDPSRGLI